jgi:hypothetical protein
MSIVADIKRAKAEFEDHVATHKCSDAFSARSRGETPCKTRVELLQAYFGTAGLWGQEHDDDTRQRDHFNRNLRPAAAL